MTATSQFVSSIGIAFTLNGAVTVVDTSSKEVYVLASTFFAASLTLSTIVSLCLTNPDIIAHLIIRSFDIGRRPKELRTSVSNRVIIFLWIMSFTSIMMALCAFMAIGVALIRSVSPKAGWGFLGTIIVLSAFGIIVNISLTFARPPTIPR